jgi:hypothetical protein
MRFSESLDQHVSRLRKTRLPSPLELGADHHLCLDEPRWPLTSTAPGFGLPPPWGASVSRLDTLVARVRAWEGAGEACWPPSVVGQVVGPGACAITTNRRTLSAESLGTRLGFVPTRGGESESTLYER